MNGIKVNLTLIFLGWITHSTISIRVTFPSLCDNRVFPLCQCVDQETKIVCLLDKQPTFHAGDTFTVSANKSRLLNRISNGMLCTVFSQFTISGDNVPVTAQSLIIDGDARFTVVVNEAANSQLKLKHLAFIGLAVVNIKADLLQVGCLYLLMNNVQKFPGGIRPHIDITAVNDPYKFPGLGSNVQATGTYLELFTRECELRKRKPLKAT